MLRSVLAVLVGLVATFVVIGLLEMLGMLIYPPPAGLDFSKPEAVRAAMATIPTGALVCVLVAQAVGTFSGAWLAAFIARRSPITHALVVGGLALLAGIFNLLSIPHPIWFSVMSILTSLPVAFAAGRVLRSRNPEVAQVGSSV